MMTNSRHPSRHKRANCHNATRMQARKYNYHSIYWLLYIPLCHFGLSTSKYIFLSVLSVQHLWASANHRTNSSGPRHSKDPRRSCYLPCHKYYLCSIGLIIWEYLYRACRLEPDAIIDRGRYGCRSGLDCRNLAGRTDRCHGSIG